MKAAFYTLGCKVNQYETQALSEQFRAKGFQIVPPEEEADDMRRRFLTGEMGKRFPVLFETTAPDGFLEGYTPNYTPVRVCAPKELCGTVREVTITGVAEDGCTGILNK